MNRHLKLTLALAATLALTVPLALCVNRVIEGRESTRPVAGQVIDAIGLRSPGERGWYEEIKLRRVEPWDCVKCFEAPGEPFVPEVFIPTEPVGPFTSIPEPVFDMLPLVEGQPIEPPATLAIATPLRPLPPMVSGRRELIAPSIPEPSTWLVMLLGFAAVATGLRKGTVHAD